MPDYMVEIILNYKEHFNIVEDPIESEDDESGSETEEEESECENEDLGIKRRRIILKKRWNYML